MVTEKRERKRLRQIDRQKTQREGNEQDSKRKQECVRERERLRETQIDSQKEIERHRQTDREIESERQIETDKGTERVIEREKETDNINRDRAKIIRNEGLKERQRKREKEETAKEIYGQRESKISKTEWD